MNIKEIIQLNNRTNNPILRWSKCFRIHFTKEIIRVPNKHVKRFSMPLVVRRTQSETTTSYVLQTC